jgi:GxxExxY protein
VVMIERQHEKLISTVVDIAFHIHDELGPGLLESLYETVLASRLSRLGIKVVRQRSVDVVVDEIKFLDAYRIDLFLEDWLTVELKALEKLSGVHIRQTLTYVKLIKQPVGLLINFGCESFKDSVRRIHNNK